MMSDVIKTISSHEEFLAIDFNNPPALIIFEETLSFPLRPKQNVCDYKTFPQDSTPDEGNLYKGLKTVDSFPQKTREVYFHPQCYNVTAFRNDIVPIIKKPLRQYLRAGGVLICRISPCYEDSVFTVCNLLSYYFAECHNKLKAKSPKRDITLVPFPYKITRKELNGNNFPYSSSDTKWIWAARWIPDKMEIAQKEMAIITEGNDDFPQRDDDCFPVLALDECTVGQKQVGTIAFAVEMGRGAIIVVPSSMELEPITSFLCSWQESSPESHVVDNLAELISGSNPNLQTNAGQPATYLLQVTDCPRLINLNKTQGNTKINNIPINDLAFLRLLVIFYASQEGELVYNAKPEVFHTVNNQKDESFALDFIFRQKTGNDFPANIATTIDKIVKTLKIPSANIFRHNDNLGSRVRLLNVKIVFEKSAWQNFSQSRVVTNCDMANILKNRLIQIVNAIHKLL